MLYSPKSILFIAFFIKKPLTTPLHCDKLQNKLKATTGNKYTKLYLFQRAVGWCETVRAVLSNTFRELLPEQSRG